METAAIITTEANREMAQVHHRAPVIVPPEAFDFWLDTRNVDAVTAAALIAPAPNGSMEVYEISPAVNRVANDSPELLEPYSADATAAATATSAETETGAQPKPKSSSKSANRRKDDKDDGQASLF